jgi:hypothetical protein
MMQESIAITAPRAGEKRISVFRKILDWKEMSGSNSVGK